MLIRFSVASLRSGSRLSSREASSGNSGKPYTAELTEQIVDSLMSRVTEGFLWLISD
jgi:hypothetical protein